MPIDNRLIYQARYRATDRLRKAHYSEFYELYDEERRKLGLPPFRDQIIPTEQERA